MRLLLLLLFTLILPLPLQSAAIRNWIVVCRTGGCDFTVPETTASINSSQVLSDGAASLSLLSTAQTTYTELRASQSYTLSAPSSYWTQINVVSGFIDQITINAAGLTGQEGKLRLGFAVTGSQSVNGLAQVTQFGTPSSPFGQQPSSRFVTGGTFVELDPYRFVFGQSFEINVLMAAVLFYGQNQPLSGFADYSNTAKLTQFAVTQQDGSTLVPNASVTAASGTNYASVPEPASIWMAALPLAALLIRRVRRTVVPALGLTVMLGQIASAQDLELLRAQIEKREDKPAPGRVFWSGAYGLPGYGTHRPVPHPRAGLDKRLNQKHSDRVKRLEAASSGDYAYSLCDSVLDYDLESPSKHVHLPGSRLLVYKNMDGQWLNVAAFSFSWNEPTEQWFKVSEVPDYLGQANEQIDSSPEISELRKVIEDGTVSIAATSDRIHWSGAYPRPTVGQERVEPFPTAAKNRINQKESAHLIRLEMAASKDFAFEFSHFVLSFDIKETGERVSLPGATLRIWKKVNGKWLMAARFSRPYEKPRV